MTTIETKEARLNELKAELAEIRAEMKDDGISNARWDRLQNYRYEIRCEIEKLQAEIDAEIDANKKVDAILTSDVQPVIVNTTFKNNRCSVNIDGAKVSLDKAVTILCESELARRGENVLLINENSDVCPLDEDLFILGKHNVKTAIRQFARGEKVTGAKVLNGKFYPVVKANAEPAAEDFARSIVAPAKMLALPAPAPVAEPVKYIATQITFPTGHEGEPTREVSKTFDNLDDAAKFIADDNPFIETETGYHTFAYDDGYFGGVYWAGYRIETTDGKILVEADIYEVKGDETIDNLVVKYINDNDNTAPEPPVNNPFACLNNLGYEDDVIEPVYGTVDEPVESKEYAVTIAQLKDAYDSAVSVWGAVDYNARTNKSLRPVVKTALATVNAAANALQAFGDAHISQLCPLLDQTIRGTTIRIINEDGIDWGSQKLADISLKFRRTGPDFAIIANDNYYATCATPDDVRRVIKRLKQAIACGAVEFSFAPQDFTPAQVETLVYYTITDSQGDKTNWTKFKAFDTTVAAAEWILSFVKTRVFDCTVRDAEIIDLRNGRDRYALTDADITAVNAVNTEQSPDTVAAVARICATVNAAAPEGWEVYYDTPSKLFAVTHNDETVARLTSVELYDAWDAHPPEDFFNAYDTHDVVEFDDDGNISAIWF